MRPRDLVFLLLIALGLGAFGWSVFSPAARNWPAVVIDGAAIDSTSSDDALRATVEQVNAAFEQTWQQRELTPAREAPPLAVARRISLALTGTVPSLEEIRHFESLPEADRLERWLAERLADRRYADYVAERLARAYVGVDDGPFLLYRRRRFVAWLADQLAANEPYDRIARHLIADSGLWTDTPATNFITLTIQPEQSDDPDPNQLAARVSRAFLGLRLDCAECHDHPFEAWKQRDFQGLAAFFGNTRQGLRGIRDVPGVYQIEDRVTGEKQTVAATVPFAPQLLPAEGTQRRRLARWVTSRENRPFARAAVNRAWALMFGRPLVEPIDNLATTGELHPALDILADDFARHGCDWQRLLATISATRAFRLDSKLAADTAIDDPGEQPPGTSWAVFPLTRLRPEQIVGSLLQSASLSTIDSSSNILVRLGRQAGQNDFVRRYGDSGGDEFEPHGGTTMQRLVMMNGKIVDEKTKDSLLGNAATRIAVLAPDDASAVETAMLAVLTRRPTEREARHFVDRLDGATGNTRHRRLGDLYWTLLNTTEFSWNH